MLAPCCEAVGVHVTVMYDSRLLRTVRADLIRPGGDTVEMSAILQGCTALGSKTFLMTHVQYVTYVKDHLCVGI